MSKIKLLSDKPYKIRISPRCEKAWKYLQDHKLNPGHYLRESGEIGVINKAIEFYLKEKKEKLPF